MSLRPSMGSRRGHLALVVSAVVVAYLAYSAGIFAAGTADAGVVGGAHVISKGKGFDKCEYPLVSQMKDWGEHSPYVYFGVYMGGQNACGSPPPRTWFEEVHATGLPGGRTWSFIPIWVGPQAPCVQNPELSRMSTNTTTAQNEANTTVDEAVRETQKRGFNTGTILYYDMEAYSFEETGCLPAVHAFINRWAGRLKEQDSDESGFYGSDGASDTDSFWELPHRLNDVWLANYGKTEGEINPSVYRLEHLELKHWEVHRFHQYRGEVFQHFGETGLKVDVDCAYGMVAGTEEGMDPECYAK